MGTEVWGKYSANYFAKSLLPQRPDDETFRAEKLTQGRRPADVWLPSWDGGGPCAVDFAVTSGLRADMVETLAGPSADVWAAYEHFKRQHLDTAASCQEQGLAFLPFVVEAHGGVCQRLGS